MPTKAVYLPGVGAKKDGCEAVSHPGAKKKFLKLVQKRRNAKRGVGAKRWVRSGFAPGCEKNFSGASRPHPPLKNPVYAPASKQIYTVWRNVCTYDKYV